MYNEIYQALSELLFGAMPDPASFEALFTTGVSAALCLGVVMLPFALLMGVTRFFCGRGV